MARTKTPPTHRDTAEAQLTKLLDTNETASLIGIGRRTLQERVTSREIACIKIGKAVRFHVDDIAAFIERNRVKAAGWKEAK